VNQKHKVITRLPIESDFEAHNIKRLSDLINDVFDHAESGMWKEKCVRTNPAELEHLLRSQALILAEIEGVLVGSVSIHIFDQGVAEFGMLAADREYRGVGIGSALVEHAESWARQNSCHTMRLKILAPRNWSHPSKEFLRQWYSRLGYKQKTTEPFESMPVDLVSELATECDFIVWYKSLD
jgi:GNAT superfamily N-acetyltransferase